jgi:hypothetical protein
MQGRFITRPHSLMQPDPVELIDQRHRRNQRRL